MAQVKWLGSPGGPDEIEFMGKRFPKGESIDIEEQRLLARVINNQFFKVEGYEAETKHDAPAVHRAPSETPVAGEVPKAGDPIVREEFQQAKSAPAKEPEDSTEAKKEDEHHPAVRAAMGKPARGK